MFDGDLAHEREFLRRVLEGVYVYNDGAILVRFREASLFEPVRSFQLHTDDRGALMPDVPVETARRAHQQIAGYLPAIRDAMGQTGPVHFTVHAGGALVPSFGEARDPAVKSVGDPTWKSLEPRSSTWSSRPEPATPW